MKISFKNSRWLVNGKRLEEMDKDEKAFMDGFFKKFKSTIEIRKIKNNETR